MDYVLDACAIIAFLRGEQGSEIVESIFTNTDNRCFAHNVNLCEVFYDFLRAADEDRANEALSDLLSIGLVNREDIDLLFIKDAGRIKAHNSMSLADCFGVALAKRQNASLVTSDRHELEPFSQKPDCPIAIQFIR